MEKRYYVSDVSTPEKASRKLLEITLVKDGMISIPIDVEAIAGKLGIVTKRLHLDNGTDGLLIYDDQGGAFVAVVSDDCGDARSRFTLAHEIGHYIKDYQDYVPGEPAGLIERRDELSSAGTDPDEIWANQFAASLLMPSNVVKTMWADNVSVEKMARRLGVSIVSLGHRLENMGLVHG